MINQSFIEVGLSLHSQVAVFEHLAQKIVESGYARDKNAVFEALKERELEGSTGMMDGFAIPHAKSSAILKPAVVVLKLENDLEWNSIDGKLINSVVALFIPENEAGTTHLTLLSQLARLLMRESFKSDFHAAQTVEEIEQLLKKQLDL